MSNQNYYQGMNRNESKALFVLPLIFAIIEAIDLVIIPWGYVSYITYQSYDTGTFFGGSAVFIFSDPVAFVYGAGIIGTVLLGALFVYLSYSKLNNHEKRTFLIRGVVFIGISTILTFFGFFILISVLSSYYSYSMGPSIPLAFFISLGALGLSFVRLHALNAPSRYGTQYGYASQGNPSTYNNPAPMSSNTPNTGASGSKFCPDCGSPTNGAKFCRNCGANLS